MPHSRGMDIQTLRASLRARLALAAQSVLPVIRAARDLLRGMPLLIIAVLALLLIAQPNPLVEYPQPVKNGLIAWLICKLSIAAYLGYWFDRFLHPKSRPGSLRDIERMAAEKRRAFIVCAAILAAGFFQ